MSNFLFEIHLEEVPQNVLSSTASSIKNTLEELLEKYGLSYHEIHYFTTARRLGFLIKDLPLKGKDREIEQKGPSLKAAYDDQGNPTRALEGFFSSYKVTKNDIEEREIKGQKYIFIRKTEPGAEVVEILPKLLADLIQSIQFTQPMRWNYNSEIYEFIRPVRGITALIDNKILPVKFFGLESSRILHGHRQLFPKPIELDSAENYEQILSQNGCIPNFDKRRTGILSSVEKLAEELQGKALLDEDLLNTLTSLTEFPHALTASFDQSFLILPKEVLISEMKIHQKYIPIVDSMNQLMPYYIIVANIPCDDPQTKMNVLAGNNRVLRARFSDGKFFFEEDIKKGIEFYAQSLSSIAFVEGAGSVADKVDRMKKIGNYLREQLAPETPKQDLECVISYCKADLASLMVGEFPELQGIIGSYYCSEMELSQNLALAVKEHYYPMNFEGQNMQPTQMLSVLAGLADRLDNLLTLYSVGKTVTGSRDPYALRRQMIAVIHLLMQFHCTDFSLSKLFTFAYSIYSPLLVSSQEEWQDQIQNFISVRLEGIMKAHPYGYALDTINAVLSRGVDCILDDIDRIKALHDVRIGNHDSFTRLIELAKRIKNILKDQPLYEFKESLLTEPAEHQLYQVYSNVVKKIDHLTSFEQLSELVGMESSVTSFFDSIMVKTGDSQEINRIALLQKIDELFLKQAEFSKLS